MGDINNIWTKHKQVSTMVNNNDNTNTTPAPAAAEQTIVSAKAVPTTTPATAKKAKKPGFFAKLGPGYKKQKKIYRQQAEIEGLALKIQQQQQDQEKLEKEFE